MEPSAPSPPSPPLEPPGSPKSTEYALSSADVEQEPVACIFCLDDLLRGTPSTDADEDIARLNPCNHIMHNKCLQPWLQRANSCPLCRTNFNEVKVLKTLDGDVFRTYPVEDKIQRVAVDTDPVIMRLIRGIRVPPPRPPSPPPEEYIEPFHAECNHCRLDNLQDTVLCGLCARFYHVECLEPRRPASVLICRRCALRERRAVMTDGGSGSNSSLRTRSLSRFQRERLVDREQLAWESAWERLEAEHSPPDDEDDDDDTENQVASILNRTNRRRAVAAAQIGGLNTFVEPAAWTEPIRRTRTAWPQGPKVITEEEKELWDTFELALRESQGEELQENRSLQGDYFIGSSRKRDGESSSRPSRSSEEHEGEVRRKRPRTRRDSQLLVNTGNGPISRSHAAHTTPIATSSSIRQLPISEGPESSPSAYSQVMSYIGKGLECSPPGTTAIVDGVRPGAIPPDFPAAPSPGRRLTSSDIATSPSPFIVGSSAMSQPDSPITEASIRRNSETVSSPTRRTPPSPPVQSIFSRPWERPPRPASSSHKLPCQAPSPPSGSDSSGNEDQQNPRKRKSINCITPEAKQGIASVVTSILQPMYPTMISKQEFTEINKKVSRQLYSIFNSENFGLDDKERWTKVAQEHVSIALKHLSV
ncbi:hypothetical protein L873DRAFT_1826854 [Choiromyces venosus 120613-1]|uniref:RING-type domain-containing protein n=1 Tax=Choiromyces venosus 120613-1 TaxID=1336337 RepID=A0A3N4K135_9PEZI|nr:hypothetical protein L873DRAFT_1826854 [Choiromyces venosus 120613-1]